MGRRFSLAGANIRPYFLMAKENQKKIICFPIGKYVSLPQNNRNAMKQIFEVEFLPKAVESLENLDEKQGEKCITISGNLNLSEKK